MKQINKFLIIALSLVLIVSCGKKRIEEENSHLREINKQLINESEEREADLNDFIESMAMIMDNLNEIKLRQDLISEETRTDDHLGQDVRMQIQEDFKVIGELMEDNRQRLIQLNQQLRNSRIRVTEFEQMVASLTSDVEERNTEISVLRDEMKDLSNSNQQLTATVDSLEEERIENLNVIEQKTEQLNTAYFVYGTRRELQDQEIIDKKGGLLGIGRTFLVNSNINKDNFTRLNIADVDKVQLPGSSPSLISIHPEDSYFVETDQEEGVLLVIENPERFWSTTRYLVVRVD